MGASSSSVAQDDEAKGDDIFNTAKTSLDAKVAAFVAATAKAGATTLKKENEAEETWKRRFIILLVVFIALFLMAAAFVGFRK